MKSGAQRIKQRFVPFVLLLPAVTLTILFLVLPLFYLVMMSFTEGSSFFFEQKFTLDNYRELFSRYRAVIQTTVFLALASAIVDLLLGYPFAYFLHSRFPYKDLARALMIFPLFGGLYLAFGLYYLFLPKGVLSPLLERLGINVLSLLYSKSSVILGMAILTFPFMVANIMTALQNIDPILKEAALCLGASRFRIFSRITLPLTGSGMVAGFLMCFGWNLGAYEIPLFLGSQAEQQVVSIKMYQQALVMSNYGLSAALGMVVMVLSFSVTYLSLRFSKGALT
jgi:ABC-type spermidine/putrescine transport system permease subunit I